MVVKALYRLGWVCVPFTLQPGRHGEGLLQVRVMLKSTDFEGSRLPSTVWVGHIQSVKGLKGKGQHIKKVETSLSRQRSI